MPRPKTLPAAPTVSRRIFFYRAEKIDHTSDDAFQPEVAARLIDSLKFESGERYLQVEDGNQHCVWVEPRVGRVRFRFGGIRSNNYPQVEALGQVSPLGLGPVNGLVDFTHVVFFPDGIIGAEFNSHGPRVTRLAYYLREKAPAVPAIHVLRLIQGDIEETLKHLQQIRMVALTLHRDEADIIDPSSAPGTAFRAAEAASDAVTIYLEFRDAPRSKRGLTKVREWVPDLARRLRSHETNSGLKVRAFDDRTERFEIIDLLKDQFVVTRSIPQQSQHEKAVVPEEMFKAIEEAYDERRESFKGAIGVRF